MKRTHREHPETNDLRLAMSPFATFDQLIDDMLDGEPLCPLNMALFGLLLFVVVIGSCLIAAAILGGATHG